ncbi:iron uptake transporter permease EfeU [Agrococcus jejuensis]|uniref:High-affinity iron transporter n=1 Tax=Agrococcus jejuensis TaxID=399736 RepID=A0A1G8CBQ6_9MICO|nr:iron uptake transporter permease EfeU [Agrococcus jejuensis]SDH42921.1 high-affinity iron transporter [Agrococcus jejuensis]
MFVNFLIGLREGLEAALVVGIIVATLVRADRRDLLRHVWLGVGLAVAGTLALGAVLTWGPYGLSFQGQELLGGILSIVAVGFITWMTVWMAKTARSMRTEVVEKVGKALARGGLALVLMAALSVIREGVETTLFIWATVDAAGGIGLATLSATAGILVAVVLGWLVYRGALRLNLGRFFTITGAVLVVVAAGVLAYGVGDLQEAGVLPGGSMIAYSLEAVLSEHGSVLGALLFGLVGYTSEPTWLQVIAWWLYVVPALTIFLRIALRRRQAPTTPPPIPSTSTSTSTQEHA